MNTVHPLCRARPRALVTALLAVPLLALGPSLDLDHAAAGSCGDIYTVQPGDTLWSIGQACGVAVGTLTRLNHLGAYLLPGQVLQLTDPDALHPYVVRPGDTLIGVAQQLGVTPGALIALNKLANPNLLTAGQTLYWRGADVQAGGATATTASAAPAAAPVASGLTYQVQPGDTLSGIALAYNVPLATLMDANGIADPNLVPAGTVLRIPSTATAAVGAATFAGQPMFNMSVTSGAYRVAPGDTLSTIAQSLGLAPETLAQMNGLALTTPIQPGQVLSYPRLVYTGPSLSEVEVVLDQQAAQVGVEDALLRAVAWRESSWRMIDATDGGMGVMQLMPDTVSWLQQTYVPGPWDPHNLDDNVHAGAVLLQVYSALYANDVAKIATAYHGGMGAVGRHNTAEMDRYINAVVAYRQDFLNGTFP